MSLLCFRLLTIPCLLGFKTAATIPLLKNVARAKHEPNRQTGTSSELILDRRIPSRDRQLPTDNNIANPCPADDQMVFSSKVCKSYLTVVDGRKHNKVAFATHNVSNQEAWFRLRDSNAPGAPGGHQWYDITDYRGRTLQVDKKGRLGAKEVKEADKSEWTTAFLLPVLDNGGHYMCATRINRNTRKSRAYLVGCREKKGKAEIYLLKLSKARYCSSEREFRRYARKEKDSESLAYEVSQHSAKRHSHNVNASFVRRCY